MSYCEICDPKKKYNDCICCSTWKNFKNRENEILNISDSLIKSSLKISTITLCFNLNYHIDIEKLKELYPPNKNGTFYNAIIYNWHTKYQLKTIVSVKIFPNGKFQVAGLASIMSCAYIIRKIYKKIYNCIKINDEENIPKILNVKIAMINSDFKLKNEINIVEFCKILSDISINNQNQNNENINTGSFISIVYQPIKYPAINSKYICSNNIQEYYNHCYYYGSKKKFKSTISILIFRSGSIIITGGNNLDDYKETYQHLLEIVNKNYLNLKIK